jgi:nitrate/nitrite transporter NarK
LSQVIYWSLPTAILTGTASAGGIALINSTGALSGFFAPYMLGYVKDTTQSLALGLYVLSALLILAGVLVMLFGPRRPRSITSPQEARPVVSTSP